MGSGGDEGDVALASRRVGDKEKITNAPFPIPHSEVIRLQHRSGTSERKIASYVLIWGASR